MVLVALIVGGVVIWLGARAQNRMIRATSFLVGSVFIALGIFLTYYAYAWWEWGRSHSGL